MTEIFCYSIGDVSCVEAEYISENHTLNLQGKIYL